MNNKIIVVIIVTALILLGGYMIWNLNTQQNNAPELNNENGVTETEVEEENPEMTQREREEIIRDYITNNISDLSPEPEVLGGTFYVTGIEFTNENSGVIEYEDGHIALTADFTYSLDSARNPTVTLTDVREL